MHKKVKRKMWMSLIILFMAGGGYWFVTRSNPNMCHRAGDVLDVLDGVAIHYNGGIHATHGRNRTPDGYNIGIRYQCVEFIKRYFGSAINTACQTPTAMPRTSSTRNCPTADGMPGAPWCSMSTEAARNPRKAIWWFFVRGYSIVTAMSPSLHPYPTIPWKLRSRIRDPGAKPAPATRWFAQKTIGSLNIRDSWAGYDFLPQKPNHLRPWNLYGLPCSCAR